MAESKAVLPGSARHIAIVAGIDASSIRRHTVRILALLLLGSGLALAAPGDADEDGVLDPLDNCLDVHNPGQRDEDRDGFGTACDPDFDNDGDVDARDLRTLARRIGRGPQRAASAVPSQRRPYDPVLDLDGDGGLTSGDLRILLEKKRRGDGPGPVQDSDGDGVADAADRCPASLGGPEAFPGCSAVDLLAAPRFVLSPPRRALQRLGGIIDVGASDLRAARSLLTDARGALEAAAATAAGGGACAAQQQLSGAAEMVARARAMFRSPPLPPDRRPVGSRQGEPRVMVEGDATREGSIVAERAMLAAIAGRVLADIVRVGEGFGQACTDGAHGRATGVVRTVDDAGRTLTLEDGRTFALADHHVLEGVITPGADVTLDGLFFDVDEAGLVTGTLGLSPQLDLPTITPCIRPRFAPAQAAFYLASVPPVLHDPSGYRVEGRYEIEARSGFGVVDACPRPSPRQEIVPRYWLQMSVTAQGYTQDTFALHVKGGDGLVPLPAWVNESVPGVVLTITTYRADCPQSTSRGVCSNVTVLRTDTYPLTVRPFGSWCAAMLQAEVLAVDDQQPGDFALNKVISYAGPYSLPNAVFGAQAYAANGSTAVVPVGLGEPYAVRTHDFFPVLDDTGLNALYAELISGVGAPSGLRWPHVAGTRNNFAYRYACTAPRVVRDVINFCADFKPDSYFRLPFAEGDGPWAQSQGNQSGGTHGNGFAYDMVSFCSDDVRAARAGVVEALTETNTQQMWNDCTDESDCPNHTCCPAGQDCDENRVWVRYQDGTYGEYVHFAPMGVQPQVGDVVRRGELLGSMGTTGNSSGPHLHFAWKKQLGNGNTILARFEVRDPTASDPTAPGAPLATCYEPWNYPASDSPHSSLYSTNQAWP